MKIETWMWLLPVVFMLHDFEEIIFTFGWLRRNAAELQTRLPARLGRVIEGQKNLSPAAFSLAVAEEFVVLSGLTLLAVERGWYDFWAGMLIAFGLHLLVHLGQWAVLRRFMPMILTSLPALAYCVFALQALNRAGLLTRPGTLLWSVIGVGIVAANLVFALWLARQFDRRTGYGR